MCLIVDNNVAHKVLGKKVDPDFEPIRLALFADYRGTRAVLNYSSDLAKEYASSPVYLKTLAELARAGRARRSPEDAVVAERKVVDGLGCCLSDDPHILALARASGARLLCSHDQNLHADFTNTAIVPTPQGKVYQTAKHVHLLKLCCTD